MTVSDELNEKDRYNEMRTVTVVGAVTNLLLSIAKILAGYIGQSQALIADGVHSLSDLLSDALVLTAAKHGSQKADDEHPYGHARVETAATVGLGILLLMVATGIGWDALRRMLDPELLLHPGVMVLVVALISIFAKEGLFHYTMRAAKRLRSNLLQGNAWHHRSDAVSSVIVLTGVGGTMAGLPYLDAVGAMGVALMIAKVGWDLSWKSLRELVDTGLDPKDVQTIRKAILSVAGVQGLHMLKTRRMGQDALVEVHIILEDSSISVSEGHQINESVRTRVMHEFDDVSEVLVHIDPEDDELHARNRHLPSRHQVVDRLQTLWEPLEVGNQVKKINLHYLHGKIQVEAILPISALSHPQEAARIAKELNQAIEGEKNLSGLQVYFTCPSEWLLAVNTDEIKAGRKESVSL